MLGDKLNEPERPFTAIIGGSKISSKIAVLKSLIQKVDTLIIGGGMAYTFIKAQGGSIGKSICEDDQLDTARDILKLADEYNTAIILPEDVRVTQALDEAGNYIDIFDKYSPADQIPTKVLESNKIPDELQGMDIGPSSAQKVHNLISQSKTILWNGPLGVFEYKAFETGTREAAFALAELSSKRWYYYNWWW